MKKLLSILLALALLLGCTAAFSEEAAASKVSLGTLSINGAFTLKCGIPEGYTPQPILANSDHVIASLNSEDPEKPIMVLSVAFDETYADVQRMNDLDDESLVQLENTYLENDPDVNITYGETGLGTLLMVVVQDQTEPNYVDFLSIYKGYFVEFVLTASPEASTKSLTQEQMKTAVDFLTDLDFVEADEAAVRAQAEANSARYTALIRNCDADTLTMTATLKTPLVLSEQYVKEALEMKSIDLDEEDIPIATAETEETGSVLINETYSLIPEEDGYHAIYAESGLGVLQILLEDVPLAVSADAVFTDYINPETLETLDEPTQHTLAEFAAMLAAEGTTEVGPGFAMDNVIITCDEKGVVTAIERVGTPWQ